MILISYYLVASNSFYNIVDDRRQGLDSNATADSC